MTLMKIALLQHIFYLIFFLELLLQTEPFFLKIVKIFQLSCSFFVRWTVLHTTSVCDLVFSCQTWEMKRSKMSSCSQTFRLQFRTWWIPQRANSKTTSQCWSRRRTDVFYEYKLHGKTREKTGKAVLVPARGGEVVLLGWVAKPTLSTEVGEFFAVAVDRGVVARRRRSLHRYWGLQDSDYSYFTHFKC